MVSRRLLFMVLVVVSCFGVAAPSSVAQDGLKEPPAVDEVEGAGLEGDNSWVSPQFDVEAEWDESWQPRANSTWSDPESGEDRVRLDWIKNPTGALYVVVLEPGRGTVPADIEAWTGNDFLSMYDVDDVDVLLEDPGTEETDGGVLLGFSDASMPRPAFHFKQSIANEDGHALYVMIEAPGDVFLGAWEAAEKGLTLNGELFDLQFDVDEVEEAIASYEAVEFSEEEAGLVGRQQFEGPICDVSVEWADSWEISYDLEYPIASDPIGLVDTFYLNQVGAGDFGPFLDVRALGAVFTDAGDRIDERAGPEFVEAIWGTGVESEVVLREVRETQAEALVEMDIPGSDEPVYSWVYYSWIEETQCNAHFRLTAPASEFEEVWTTVTEEFDIQIAGEPLEYLLNWDEIEEAME
jgi:hypothetical protein